MLKNLSVFIDSDDKVTVHSAQCSHVLREWRKYGRPVIAQAESVMGAAKQLKALGIRVESFRIMPCANLPEGFWSSTPGGSKLKLLSTETGAQRATRRVLKQVREEWQTTINNMSPYLREAFGLQQEMN
jgi:hypothetical protein